MLCLLLLFNTWSGVWGNQIWEAETTTTSETEIETYLRFTDPGTGNGYGVYIGKPPNLDNIDSAITVFVRGRGGTPDGDAEVAIVGDWYVFTYLGVDGYRWQVNSNFIDITPTDWYDGDWHTIACTYDSAGGADNIIIQVDGIEIKKGTKTGGITASSNIWVGTRLGNAYHLDGDLSEIQIYSRVLDSTEIAWLHSHEDSVYDTTALHLWYPMNEGTGDTVYDYSNYANHGILKFGVEWVTE
jgi:hypothetical protein